MSPPIRFSEWHPVRTGWHYAPIPSEASGVYVIADRRTGRALYVGRSTTRQLRKTFRRHFQRWQQDWMHASPRQTYESADCIVCWLVVRHGPDAVAVAEREAMLVFRPRDNFLVPPEVAEGERDVAPF